MMKRLLYLLPVMVIAVVIAVACSTKEEEEKFGEISGIVYDDNVGEPISIAQIKLMPGGNSTVTGSDGSFSFINILSGDYTVTVTKKGYEDGINTVSVVGGKRSECNIKMKRIPAYVTADKEVLDFGDNITLNTLSFNIVNGSYENLSWHIHYDTLSSFVTQVSPDKGTTPYGKTAAIVVKINREKLNAGNNETTIQVISDNGDGSSEVRIKAIGQEKALPTLNIIDITDITSSSVRVHGKITFVGTPPYYERGFVYDTNNPEPEYDNCEERIPVTKTDDSIFTCKIKGLDLDKKYYVRAYARSNFGIAYSNPISFTTVASQPIVHLDKVDNYDANNKTVTLYGSVEYEGDPTYKHKGFVYCEGRNTPTINNIVEEVEGTEKGNYKATIGGLKIDVLYSVRAYATNNNKDYAYSDTTIEFTLSGTKPKVSIGKTDINRGDKTAIFHGRLEDKGIPPVYERGFVYSYENETPNINEDECKQVEGKEVGTFEAKIENLILGKTYYVRAYAKNETGTTYSESVDDFSTVPIAAIVEMRSAIGDDVNLTAVFKGAIVTVGDPPYDEKGFVYSAINNTPTLNDISVHVEGRGTGIYEKTVSDLTFGKKYYVRAYARNENVTTYSDTVSFELKGTTPNVSVSAANDISLSSHSATLNGYVSEIGYPAINERGFVYSCDSNTPTINDSKVTADGEAKGGSYSASINNLALDKTYYVKAYVSNSIGIYYSKNTIELPTHTTSPSVSISPVTNMDMDIENKTVTVTGRIDNAGNPEYSEKGFVYSYNNQYPTVENDKVEYVSGNQTGTFTATLNNLVLGMKYYVRAFAKNETSIAYSPNKPEEFLFNSTLPEVQTGIVTDLDINNSVVILHGSITEIGNPPYEERGFVLSTQYKLPTIDDQKIPVSGSGTGNFELRLTEFSKTKDTWVRTYAINKEGVAYSDTAVRIFDTSFLDMGDYIVLGSKGIAVQKEDIGYGNWYDMNRLCQNSRVGGFSNWRLPNYDELCLLYNMKEQIGNFKEDYPSTYWSSKYTWENYSFKIFNQGKYDYYNETKYYYYGVDFNNGSKVTSYPYDTYYKSESATGDNYARAVRSL